MEIVWINSVHFICWGIRTARKYIEYWNKLYMHKIIGIDRIVDLMIGIYEMYEATVDGRKTCINKETQLVT